MRIEDDAQERAPARKAGAIGQGGIVGEDGADAGEDGVGRVAQTMDFGAGLGAGEPVGRCGAASLGRRSEVAVGGEGGFEREERAPMLDGVGEGQVELACRLLFDADADGDAGGVKLPEALTAYERVGIFCGHDAAGDAGGNQGVGAGGGAAVVRAGLEGDVGRGSADVVAEGCGCFRAAISAWSRWS